MELYHSSSLLREARSLIKLSSVIKVLVSMFMVDVSESKRASHLSITQ